MEVVYCDEGPGQVVAMADAFEPHSFDEKTSIATV